MAICKFCGAPMQWGRFEDRWLPLVPLGEEGDLERGYQDESGNLRAAHRLICSHVGAVRVTKLAVPVQADMILPQRGFPEAPNFEDDSDGGALYAAAVAGSSGYDPTDESNYTRSRKRRSRER